MNATSLPVFSDHKQEFLASEDALQPKLDEMLSARHVRATDEHPLEQLLDRRLIDRGVPVTTSPPRLTSFSTDPGVIRRASQSHPELFKPRLAAIAEATEPGN